MTANRARHVDMVGDECLHGSSELLVTTLDHRKLHLAAVIVLGHLIKVVFGWGGQSLQ